MAVLTNTHNLCFEQKLEKISENFQFLEVKFSIYLNRRVFVMCYLRDLDTLVRFSSIFTRETTFVTPCLLSWAPSPSEKGSAL